MTSERLNNIYQFPLRPIKRLEAMGELAMIETKLEPLERRAEELRRALGLISLERGMEG